MEQIVTDTCVLYAGLYSNRGISFQLLKMIGSDQFKINLSVPLVLEYEDVLKRDSSKITLSDQQKSDVLDYLISVGRIHKVFFLWRPLLKDPKDDMVLELAVKSNSRHIVTFNKSDFVPAHKFGIQVETPYEFLLSMGGIN